MADEAIDRYQIREKIGAGGMGTVYRAWDSEIERDVALKWLPAYFSADVTFTERFKREARVVARLEHPHIVPIYDVGENEGRPFIIMRLLNGGTLREQIEKPEFDLAALVRALEEIGDALAAAHARQIIHRDIKPGNILFDENGAAFLSDFGIAKVLDSATQLTGSGFIGTPAYMSPEQFIGQGVDGRGDQYSLAVVVYESLTGSLPFSGNTAQMMYKHINAVPPGINLADHPIPAALNPILQKGLAKDPDDRYAHIKDFVAAMKTAVRADPAAASALLSLAGGAALSTGQKPATAPTDLNTPVEQETALLQQNYRDGLEALSRSEWAGAAAAFGRVLQTAPDYGNAAEFKRQAEANLAPPTPVPPVDETTLDIPPAVILPLAAEQAEEVNLAPPTPVPPVDETTLDIPPAVILPLAAEQAEEVDLEPPTPVPPVDETTLDIPPAVILPLAAEQAAEAGADLPPTSLDLPLTAGQAAAAGMTEVEIAQPDLNETSVDLPPVVGTQETSVDLPPAAAAATMAAAEAQPPSVEAQEKRSGYPLWAVAAAVILLLLLCGGAAYAGVNFFGGGQDDGMAAQDIGSSNVAFGSADTDIAAAEEDTVAAPTASATSKKVETPQLKPTAEPVEEPTVVSILAKATEAPATSTDEPTETPEPQLPIVRVNVASANLRRGPGTIYSIIRAVFLDETAAVLAKNRDGSWYNVEFDDGVRAWLAASVIELVNDVDINSVAVAATIPVAPTLTPVPPTWTPPPPLVPPTSPPSDGGGGGGGDDDDDDDGDDGGGDTFTREPPPTRP